MEATCRGASGSWNTLQEPVQQCLIQALHFHIKSISHWAVLLTVPKLPMSEWNRRAPWPPVTHIFIISCHGNKNTTNLKPLKTRFLPCSLRVCAEVFCIFTQTNYFYSHKVNITWSNIESCLCGNSGTYSIYDVTNDATQSWFCIIFLPAWQKCGGVHLLTLL